MNSPRHAHDAGDAARHPRTGSALTGVAGRGLAVISVLAMLPAGPIGAATPGAGPAPRVQFTVDDQWRFLPADRPDAAAAATDDSTWTTVEIPHTWNAADPFDDEPDYRRGPSWYRKRLHLDPQLRGRRLFLHFEGVHQLTDVFVNEKPVGQHKGGYTAFAFDITDCVTFDRDGADALLAVRVDNGENDSIPPLSIGYAFYGGIYRDVWLIATDPVHFDVVDHAAPGIHVDTPGVSAESSRVRVRGTVVNDGPATRRLEVITRIFGPDDLLVATIRSAVPADARGRAPFEQQSELIPSPKLWSPDTPNLYRVESVICDGDQVLDEVRTRLGFRWFRFDPEKGFELNGRKLILHGASRHQDFQGRGSALPDSFHRNDLEWIKRMGGNFVRLAHYPQEQEVLDAADRLGLVVWEEIPIVSTMSRSPEFARTARINLTEMIRQHYNHPAIIMWGYMNEVLLDWRRENTSTRDADLPEAVVTLARELEAILHREDPTRVSVMAMDATPFYDEAGIAGIPQVSAWNIYSGWYSEGLDGFGRFLDRQHQQYPRRCLVVSEYGAGSDERLHGLKTARFDHTTEYQCLYHESHIRQIRERPWLGGTLIWNEFDFSQPKAGDSIAHVNQKGMLTWDRRPKDAFYLYQANWIADPVLHICGEWSRRTGSPTAGDSDARGTVSQPVKVYSNLAEVELFANGASLGLRKPDEVRSITWPVPFLDGWNVLEARGHRDGREVRDMSRVHFKRQATRLADPKVPFDELAVNIGSSAQFIDAGGVVWDAERTYTDGAWGFVGGQDRYARAKESRASPNILGSVEDPLYQLFREGIDSFRADIPDGDYEVDLRFTEYTFKQPGKRVFRVLFNGVPLIDRLDLFAQYGHQYAVARVFRVRVRGGTGATLKFEPIVGQPLLCGVRIRRLP